VTLPSSGPLSLSSVQGEFGGSNPIGMNEYYAGGGHVPSGTSGTYGSVPSSGTISIQSFYGTSNYSPISSVDIGGDQNQTTLTFEGAIYGTATVSGGNSGSYTYTWNYSVAPANSGGYIISTSGNGTPNFSIDFGVGYYDEVASYYVSCTVSDGISSLTSPTVTWTLQQVS